MLSNDRTYDGMLYILETILSYEDTNPKQFLKRRFKWPFKRSLNVFIKTFLVIKDKSERDGNSNSIMAEVPVKHKPRLGYSYL